jgi:hypothetical protein
MKEKFLFWLLSKLPVTLVYYCGVHIISYSTTGRYGNTILPELTFAEGLERYYKDKVQAPLIPESSIFGTI